MNQNESEQAWPFLVGRTRTEDHRVVVAPAFMTGDGMAGGSQAGILRSQTAGEAADPGTAYLRGLPDAPGDPVTVVYRVLVPRQQDYGLPGAGLLADEHGRPIVITEGVVLRRLPGAVAAEGVSQVDLDRAHELVAGAFREFWSQGAAFGLASSAPFPLTTADERGPLVTLLPCDEPTDSRQAAPATEAGGASSAQAGGNPSTETTDSPAAGTTSAPATEAAPRGSARPPAGPGRTRRTVVTVRAVVAVAVVAAALAAAVGFWPARSTRLAATPGAALSRLCAGLLVGRPADGYALTTPAYRRETPEARFAALLRAGPGPADQCTAALRSAPRGGRARALALIAGASGSAVFRLITLERRDGGWWISGVAADGG